jgi:hypothetical protein
MNQGASCQQGIIDVYFVIMLDYLRVALPACFKW